MKLSRNLLVALAMAVLLVGAPALFSQGQEQMRKQSQHGIHDANSDGICDECGQPVGSGLNNAQGKKANKDKHWGPADGSGNQGSGPKDGTGYGSQSGRRIGPQDGTGPYHQNGGQGQRRGGGRGGRS
jgi:hypothetical protein